MLFIRAGPNTAALPSQPSHPNEDYRGNAELVKMQKENKREREVIGSVLVCFCGCDILYFIVSWGGNGPYVLM